MKRIALFLYLFSFLDILNARLKVNLREHDGALCARTCEVGQTRICYFQFNIEFYQAMGVACNNCINGNAKDCNNPQCVVGDGMQKGFMSINRQLPGPPIHICLGDYLVVDVINKAPGTTVTLHWHGLDMRDAKFMDGVPFITQCPISFATSFRYQFEPKLSGTYFYHSHAGFQRVNGIYGALIIRQPRQSDPLAVVYDYDFKAHTLVISDWLHHYAEWLYPGIQSNLNKPDAVLLNGRGTLINNKTRIREIAPPPHIIYVEPGRKYRFRTIGAQSFNCLMQLQIQSHKLTVIATDGYDVDTMMVDTVVLNAGERYDFVLYANQPPNDYWIRLRGLAVCELNSLTEAFILLRYNYRTYNFNSNNLPIPMFPNYDDTYPKGALLNFPNQTCNNFDRDSCVTRLKGLRVDNGLRDAIPDVKLYLGFHNYPLTAAQVFNTGRYDHFRNLENADLDLGGINNITFVEPSSPLLSQLADVEESMFCNEHYLPRRCNNIANCPCVHRIKLPKGAIVEMLLVDETTEPQVVHHPMHLHGQHFMVTDLNQCPFNSNKQACLQKVLNKFNNNRWDDQRSRNWQQNEVNPRPPMKDTISVPTYGYAIVRFRADNVGFWFFHCHYEYHTILGMSLVFQVGEESEMPNPPKGFPKCGNYLPDVLI